MEIIHLVLGKANPERMNGVNKVVHELATVQAEKKQRVQIWGITKTLEHTYPERSFKTQLFRTHKNPFRLDKRLKEKFLSEKENIIVHIHGAFVPVFFSAAKFLHKHSIQFVFTPHGSFNFFMMKKNKLIKKIYFFLFEKKLLANASQIHLLGKSEMIGLYDIYPNNKSNLIPYGYRISDSGKEENNIFQTKFTIGFCGRIDITVKGLDILLKGFSLFFSKNPESRLIIIGDGRELEKLKRLASQLNIQHAVEFMGSKFGKEKIQLLRSMDIFAHPSRTEGLPASLMETCSLGIPCIISEETNFGDWIKEYNAGSVLTKTDAENFAVALTQLHNVLVSQNKTDIIKNNCSVMVKEVFNWSKVIDDFNIMYNKLKRSPAAAF